MKTKTMLLVSALILGGNSLAQNQFSLHGSLLAPTGLFGNGVELDYTGALPDETSFGYAAIGLGFGFESRRMLNEKGLYLHYGADLFWNGMKNSVKTDTKGSYDSSEKATFSDYFNVPLGIGLGYRYSLNTGTSLFVQASPCLNLLKISKSTYTSDSDGGSFVRREFTYNMGYKIGFQIGGGAVFKDRYIARLKYNALGTYTLTQSRTYMSDSYTDDDTENIVKSISCVELSFGLILGNQ